jgi:hypothetical protein
MAATKFKGLPEKDVMWLLGWTDPRSLKLCYEHADTASTLPPWSNGGSYVRLPGDPAISDATSDTACLGYLNSGSANTYL